MRLGIVLILAVVEVILFYILVTREPGSAGTGRQQYAFAAGGIVLAAVVVGAQRDHLSDPVAAAIVVFFLANALALGISAARQNTRDRADAQIRAELRDDVPGADTASGEDP